MTKRKVTPHLAQLDFNLERSDDEFCEGLNGNIQRQLLSQLLPSYYHSLFSMVQQVANFDYALDNIN